MTLMVPPTPTPPSTNLQASPQPQPHTAQSPPGMSIINSQSQYQSLYHHGRQANNPANSSVSSSASSYGLAQFPHSVEQIQFDELIDLNKTLGKGSFGVVSLYKWKGRKVAVKEIANKHDQTHKEFVSEVRQLARVSHPNIVKFYGVIQNPVCLLVMEYCDGGSLFNVMHSTSGGLRIEYTIAHAMNWLLQLAQAVAYLHGMKPKPLIHRDLKSPNLLLVVARKGDSGTSQTQLKICDFGTACDKATIMTNNKGSAAWMAPEVFKGKDYSEKCDIYSWAIILWEVLTRQKPYSHLPNCTTYSILWAAQAGTRPSLISNCPPPVEQLMTLCWDKEPEVRPSMDKVVEIMTDLVKLFPGFEKPLTHSIVMNEDEEGERSNIPSTPEVYDDEHEAESDSEPVIFHGYEDGVQTVPTRARLRYDDPESTHSTLGNPNNTVQGFMNFSALSIDCGKDVWRFEGESDDIVMIQGDEPNANQIVHPIEVEGAVLPQRNEFQPSPTPSSSTSSPAETPTTDQPASPIPKPRSKKHNHHHGSNLQQHKSKKSTNPFLPIATATTNYAIGWASHIMGQKPFNLIKNSLDFPPLGTNKVGPPKSPNKAVPESDGISSSVNLGFQQMNASSSPKRFSLDSSNPFLTDLDLKDMEERARGNSFHGESDGNMPVRKPSVKKGHKRSSSYGSTNEYQNTLGTISSESGGWLASALGLCTSANIEDRLDSLYDNAYTLLSPELQPVPPIPTVPDSVRIYEEHINLARDYMFSNTQFQCLLKAKQNLEAELRSCQMGGEAEMYFAKMREAKSENEALILFHKELKEQLQILKGTTTPMFSDIEPEPGWVFVNKQNNAATASNY